MKLRTCVVAVGCLLGLGFLGFSGFAEDNEPEQEVSLKKVPAKVKAAAKKAVKGIELQEAEVEAVLMYELEGRARGKQWEILVTAEGKVVTKEQEDDDDDDGKDDGKDDDEAEHELEIPLRAVPKKVRAAAEKTVRGIKLSEAEVVAVLVYEVEGEAHGKEYEIELTADGKVLEIESEKDENDDKDDKDDND